MARYWIRNRGRVQGPFSEERIHGLLRRGRFSRHFHVSEDRRNWYPASDFPELFEGTGGAAPVDDESPFQGGGSPFDDEEDEDDAPPARLPTSERRRRPAPKRSIPADDDDDEDDDDSDDEEWDDDDSAGVLTGFVNWVEANVKALVVVLVLVLGTLSWFVFMREDFTQDTADYEVLMAVQSRMMQADPAKPDEWITMLNATEKELAPMVTRLEKSASAMDMVKQEMLFLARDDIPAMFKELQRGKQDAANLVRIRFSLIDEMITSQTRFHDGSKLRQQPAPQAPPAQNPAPENGTNLNGRQPAQGQPAQGQPGQSSGNPQPSGSATPPNTGNL